MTHKCAALGCKREISLALLMCKAHWYKVPGPIRKRILNTVGDRDRTRYRKHVRDAIEAVAKIEGRQHELTLLELPLGDQKEA